jgi:hypothetical protein
VVGGQGRGATIDVTVPSALCSNHHSCRCLLLRNLNANLESRVAFGQTAFDSPEVRATADIVTPDLLRGPHYQLGPTVSTFAFMNNYSVTSDYGPFTAPSDARLRRLIREIAAIAEL